MSTIHADDIVTLDDTRGMHSLLTSLGGSPAERAARLLLEHRQPLALCTGFPVAGRSESDGPAGAVMLAKGLQRLGREVSIVSWPDALASWACVLDGLPQLEVPVGRPLASQLAMTAVTIEVCGRLQDGRYENMRQIDVAADAPWFEDALGRHVLVSIGDGGNEFGMGSAPEAWFRHRTVRRPVSTCQALVVGQVSNWAALAVLAVLSRLTLTKLLPEPEQYQDTLDALARSGVVDGVTRTASPTEDGHALGAGPRVVEQLQRWTAARARGSVDAAAHRAPGMT